nr:unnamed protein product [Callosobruchus chinensis]
MLQRTEHCSKYH